MSDSEEIPTPPDYYADDPTLLELWVIGHKAREIRRKQRTMSDFDRVADVRGPRQILQADGA